MSTILTNEELTEYVGAISESLNDKMDRDSNNANPAVVKYSDLTSLQNQISALQLLVNSLQQNVSSLQGDYQNMFKRMDYTNSSSVSISESSPYTCTQKGYIKYISVRGNGYYYFKINNKVVSDRLSGGFSLDKIPAIGNIIALSVGDTLSVQNDGGGSPTLSFTFYPEKAN